MIKRFLKNLLGLIPGKKYIVFESIPDLSDSPKAVFDEMLARGLQKKYKMVWFVSDKNKKFPKLENTIYVDMVTKWNSLVFLWYRARAKCLISCNRFLPKQNERQTSIYITHGTAIKRTASGYVAPEGMDYILVASDHVKEIIAEELETDVSRLCGLGYPRNDILHQVNCNLHEYLHGDFDKVIVWYPTFRQHKNGHVNNGGNALPIIHDAAKAQELNEIAKQNRVLIVMKPHFVQDLSYVKDCNLSNIVFINDEFFMECGLSSYEFVGSCDALVTDYSSIYYDFLLCDKHVAVVWEDIDEYRANPGFAVDVNYYLKGAEKIYELKDFETFIRHVATGEDPLKAERAEINELVNHSTDGKNAERVVNFIVEKARL